MFCVGFAFRYYICISSFRSSFNQGCRKGVGARSPPTFKVIRKSALFERKVPLAF